MASRFMMAELLIPGLFSLTLIGMALALAYHRTGNLYFSLGLHGGLVFCLKTFNALTLPGPKATSIFGISKNAYDGWPGFAMAALAFLLVSAFLGRRKNSDAPPT
jgi:membrane protease YdiL (CAAX protease family)